MFSKNHTFIKNAEIHIHKNRGYIHTYSPQYKNYGYSQSEYSLPHHIQFTHPRSIHTPNSHTQFTYLIYIPNFHN